MKASPNQPPHGVAADLDQGLIRVIAANPSAMTYWGTNSYLVGEDAVAIIDPGPDDPAHLAALLDAIDGRPVTHILVTHSHLDHSALARRLAQKTGAPVCGYGPSHAGRSSVMQDLARAGLTGGGEGVDPDFTPDIALSEGDSLAGPWGRIVAIHTPGHIGNHMCFAWKDRLFCGDHVMGWASTLVSPPDGDLGDFLRSCEKLMGVAALSFLPGHGAPIAEPRDRLAWLVEHRHARSDAILEVLGSGPASPYELTKRIYTQTPRSLWPAAQRNVLAHLIYLADKGAVTPQGPLHDATVFTLGDQGSGQGKSL